MLEAKGLVKIYGTRRVVDGVDFRVDSGEIVGLLGPNGAGKTTSFRMTCGMIVPNAGKVKLDGVDITDWPMYRRAREGGMGYLAQESSVFRKLTVEKNLLGVMELLGFDRKTRNRRCKELLEQFDITRLRKSLALSLSGGERRRLEIARCLVSNPKIILLDEPFTGIDPVTIASIQKIIRRLRDRRDRHPDHRPPGPRDAANHRPQLRDPRRQGALPRPARRGAGQSRSPQVLLRRGDGHRAQTPRAPAVGIGSVIEVMKGTVGQVANLPGQISNLPHDIGFRQAITRYGMVLEAVKPPRGQDSIAQGTALGNRFASQHSKAQRAVTLFSVTARWALCRVGGGSVHQGVALGYRVRPPSGHSCESGK